MLYTILAKWYEVTNMQQRQPATVVTAPVITQWQQPINGWWKYKLLRSCSGQSMGGGSTKLMQAFIAAGSSRVQAMLTTI
ncbi:hypothetical protein TSUD_250160 [Trifolium subterraneum]|nr:hypothetical protein TSUD_250160 [Trifolium subterraneum]